MTPPGCAARTRILATKADTPGAIGFLKLMSHLYPARRSQVRSAGQSRAPLDRPARCGLRRAWVVFIAPAIEWKAGRHLLGILSMARLVGK
ncbi:hypothetical protein D3C78_695160 [compost metagenome]